MQLEPKIVRGKALNPYTLEPLLSFSTIKEHINKSLFETDYLPLKKIFDDARERGSVVSTYILGKSFGWEPEKNDEHYNFIKTFKKFLKKYELKNFNAEEYCFNYENNTHGYLDISTEDYFIEVKTRNDLTIRDSDYEQIEFYKQLSGRKGHLLILTETNFLFLKNPDTRYTQKDIDVLKEHKRYLLKNKIKLKKEEE